MLFLTIIGRLSGHLNPGKNGENAMRNIIRSALSSRTIVFAGIFIWGLIEFIALQRSRRRRT
jgi:hypothetical protein